MFLFYFSFLSYFSKKKKWGSGSNEIARGVEGNIPIPILKEEEKEQKEQKFVSPIHKVASSGFESKNNGLSHLLGDFGNICRMFLLRKGGLWISANVDFKLLKEKRCTFTKNLDVFTEKILGKGCQICLFDMQSKWGKNRKLIVINTHLAYTSTEIQIAQCTEIKETLNLFLKENKEIEYKNCGVLFAGDFNMYFEGKAYLQLNSLFGGHLRDLYKENNPENEVATLDCDNFYAYISRKARIDYIYSLDAFKNGDEEEEEIQFMRLEATECKVEKQNKGEEFGDHYPVVATIQPVLN